MKEADHLLILIYNDVNQIIKHNIQVLKIRKSNNQNKDARFTY